jgi:hypothetical protein
VAEAFLANPLFFPWLWKDGAWIVSVNESFRASLLIVKVFTKIETELLCEQIVKETFENNTLALTTQGSWPT